MNCTDSWEHEGIELGDCTDSASVFLDSLRVFGSVFSQSQIKISSTLLKEDISRNSDLLIRLVCVVILQPRYKQERNGCCVAAACGLSDCWVLCTWQEETKQANATEGTGQLICVKLIISCGISHTHTLTVTRSVALEAWFKHNLKCWQAFVLGGLSASILSSLPMLTQSPM